MPYPPDPNMRHIYDVLIVGMGPAGLAAGSRLRNSGLSIAIVDSGKSVHNRDRYDASDATSGHGGAGLFSDGKFSFFPSATHLWTLPRDRDLKDAYEYTCNTLGDAGLDCPPYPESPEDYSGANGKLTEMEEWILKEYPSDYLSLEARIKLVEDMVNEVDGDMFNELHVRDIKYDSTSDIFTMKTRSTSSNKKQSRKAPVRLYARRIIVTTGRFGPLAKALRNLTSAHTFHRLEIGFRIEQSSDKAFFRNMRQLDPKLRFGASDGKKNSTDCSVEWRTFCVCRQGEAVLTETEKLWTVSGRSDCPPTGRSNSGFNTRILDRKVAARTVTPLIKALGRPSSHFNIPMVNLLEGQKRAVSTFDKIYGQELRRAMTTGLQRLGEAFPDLGEDKEARLIGPTLEGVGWYPKVTGDLQLVDCPAFVAGDACGLFRGIVAAMISGHYAAAAVEENLQRSGSSSVVSSP